MDFDMAIEQSIDGIVTDLQDALRGRILSDPWFSGIDIFTPDDMSADGLNKVPADIEQRITQTLSSVKGLCIVIALPAYGSVSPDSPGIYSDDVPILVRVIENPQMNRSSRGLKKPAGTVATRIMRRLHHFTYRDCVIVVKSAKRIPDENALIWDVISQTALNLPPLEVQSPETGDPA